MPPFAGYGLGFFISSKLFAVLSFECYRFYKAHYVQNTKRYDKTETISGRGAYMNFLLLDIKTH